MISDYNGSIVKRIHLYSSQIVIITYKWAKKDLESYPSTEIDE